MSIMLPPDSQENNGVAPGWRANDLTPADIHYLIPRFIRYFTPGGPDECWLWQAGRMPSGYGLLRRSQLPALLAHRVAWVAFTGHALSDQLTIDHLCNVTACVNPQHLEPVTLAENLRRRNARAAEKYADRPGRTACGECGSVLNSRSMARHNRVMHGAAA